MEIYCLLDNQVDQDEIDGMKKWTPLHNSVWIKKLRLENISQIKQK